MYHLVHITSHNLPYEKVGKNELVCIADEVPFEIPESWEWVRLGELFQHNTGKALNSSNRSGKLLTYITTSNLYWNRFEIDNLREMYFSEAEIQKCTAIKGDFLVCEGGDIGRAAIWSYDTDIRIQNHIHRLRPYYEICVEYYYYIFSFINTLVGLAVKELAFKDFPQMPCILYSFHFRRYKNNEELL